jgi:osmotically-inducible protein OsmY
MKTDHELQREVLDELAWDPSIHAAHVGVTAREGVVTLSGHVASYAEKLAAEKAARRVEGVRAVAEEVEVRVPSSAKRDDADIARAALDALKWSVNVPNDQLRLVVENGWIKLDGEVDWRYQAEAAAKTVRYLTGVRGVTNNVRVRRRVHTHDVREAITAALKRSAEVEARQIAVEAADGTVTLRGRVHSWKERDAAERAAWSAAGVMAVDDRLTVEGHSFV